MSENSRNCAIVLLFSIAVVAVIYTVSWNKSNYDADIVSFQNETKHILESMNSLSSIVDDSRLEGKVCKASIAIQSYELRKDATRNAHRYITLFSNLAHTNALFITILIMIICGLMFSLYQMTTAYTTKRGTKSEILIQAANIKVKTGYVSIAVSIVALIALSFYLKNAHEVKELSERNAQNVKIDFSDILKICKELEDGSS